MKYLGTARKENGNVLMPDTFADVPEGREYEAVEIGGDIPLSIPPPGRERPAKVERLADRSMEEHRKTLNRLARLTGLPRDETWRKT